MGRGHTIPGQPHPSHPAQKGEIMRRSAEPKHLKETDKPKAPKNILAAATVAASAGALIMTATPALAEESASETASAKDTTQTETAATTTESAKQTLDEATAAHDKAAADAATAKQDLADAQAQKDQDAYDAAAENEQKTADDLRRAQADHDAQKATDDAVKQIDNAQQPGGHHERRLRAEAHGLCKDSKHEQPSLLPQQAQRPCRTPPTRTIWQAPVQQPLSVSPPSSTSCVAVLTPSSPWASQA